MGVTVNVPDPPKQCPHGFPHVVFCRRERCQVWETKTEDAGLVEGKMCPRAVVKQCEERCGMEYRRRHLGRCGMGGDWVTTGYTTRAGSPFCGTWREPTAAVD